MLQYIKLKLSLTIFIISSSILIGQQKEIKPYLENNAIKFSNNAPHKAFNKIKSSIGDARVILLGEQDHGDGTTMEFKSKFVKYLHQECGFDLLIFESNFFPLQNLLESDQLNFEETQKYIYPIWTNCYQCSELFSYLDSTYKTPSPLLVTGIDNQMYFYQFNYAEAFKELCRENNISLSDTTRFYKILGQSTVNNQNLTIDKLNYLLKELKLIKNTLHDNDFVSQELVNLSGYLEMKKVAYTKNNKPHHYHAIRDSTMAKNLLWLIKKRYPNRKVIVWAHNIHISRDNPVNPSHYFGEDIYNAIGNDMYSIAFTSYEGESHFANGNIKTTKTKAPKNSLESWLYNLGYSNAFIDLKGITNKNVKFSMKSSNLYSMKMEWSNVFDGIVYIKSMEPCIKINPEL